MTDLTFGDAPTGGKAKERPKEGAQFGIIAQLVNEGTKLNTFKNPPAEYTSLFVVVQLAERSKNPERNGERLLTRVYFPYNRFEPKPGMKGQPSKMMKLLRSLYGSSLEEIVKDKPALADLFENIPVMVNVKWKDNGGWETQLSPFPEGIPPLELENYNPWVPQENTSGADPVPEGEDGIPF